MKNNTINKIMNKTMLFMLVVLLIGFASASTLNVTFTENYALNDTYDMNFNLEYENIIGYQIDICFNSDVEFVSREVFWGSSLVINKLVNENKSVVASVWQIPATGNSDVGKFVFKLNNSEATLTICKAEVVLSDMTLEIPSFQETFVFGGMIDVVINDTNEVNVTNFNFKANETNTVTFEDQTDISIDINVDSDSTEEITIEVFTNNPVAETVAGKLELKFLEISTNMTIINATISIELDSLDGIEVSTLKMYHFNETALVWEELESWVEGNTVFGITTSFSKFGVFADAIVEGDNEQEDTGGSGSGGGRSRNRDRDTDKEPEHGPLWIDSDTESEVKETIDVTPDETPKDNSNTYVFMIIAIVLVSIVAILISKYKN